MICHEVVNTTPQNDQTGLGVRSGGKDLFCCIPIANSKFYGRRVWCTVLLVLARSGCPVMVVGPNTLPATAGAWSPRHLMAVVALSHEGLKAIVHSFHLAREVGASLYLFMIFDRENTVDHKDWQFLRLALAEKLPGVDIEKELPHECVPRDQAVHRVLDLSSLREADAIIVSEECGGSKHPHFQRDIISRLSAESRCPLIVVPRDQSAISS